MASHFAHATSLNPYAPLDQLARVLVLIEKEYVDPAPQDRLIDGAVKGMVAELDPHSSYMSPADFMLFQSDTEGKFAGVGVEVDMKNDVPTVIAPIEDSPAARAGICSGDQIIAVDGKPIRGERLDKLVRTMRGPSGSTVRLTVKRPAAPDPMEFSLTRQEIRVASVAAKRLERDVVYVRIKQFQEGTHRELLQALATLRASSPLPARGVLLDLRSNPGGLVDEAEAIADEFLTSGVIYSTRHRGKTTEEVRAHDGGALSNLPVVALVNEYTASSSELLAGALQDNGRAILIGGTTFGKGSVQTIFDLPGGAGAKITTLRYYTPSGRSIQAQGVRPDIALSRRDANDAGLLVRERDLDGHLPAEVSKEPAREAQRVLVEPNDAVGSESEIRANEIPADPTKGRDFALRAGFEELVRSTRP